CVLRPGRVNHSGKGNSGSTLHVVVVDTVLVAVALEQMDCVHTGPVLKMNAALWEDLLHSVDKFVDKRVEFLGSQTRFAHAEVERVVEVLLIISTGIEIHRQQILWRNASAGSV